MLSESKGKEGTLLDVGDGRLRKDSGATVLGVFWITQEAVLHSDGPLLLAIIVEDGFRIVQARTAMFSSRLSKCSMTEQQLALFKKCLEWVQ